MTNMKKILVPGLAALALLGGCGGSRYSAYDVYDYGSGLSYVDACNLGVYPACTGLYGNHYFDNGAHRSQHRYARGNPVIIRQYMITHPAVAKRSAATKVRVQAKKIKDAAKARVQKTQKSSSKPKYKSSSYSTKRR